jgi:hypothetical protein
MRRVALSVSVNKRERPRAFVRHATAMCDLILRRRALPECDDPLYRKFHREFRSVFFETAPGHASSGSRAKSDRQRTPAFITVQEVRHVRK